MSSTEDYPGPTQNDPAKQDSPGHQHPPADTGKAKPSGLERKQEQEGSSEEPGS